LPEGAERARERLPRHLDAMTKTKLADNQKRIDFFPTPSWCVHRLLEVVDLPGGFWLEPAVGDGAIVRAVNEVRDDVCWTKVDIRPECDADLISDYTWCNCPSLDGLGPSKGQFDVIITNPPFSQAIDFVQASLVRSPIVAMLLRLNWLGSDKRSAFLRKTYPDVYVLPQRPSFDGRGTDFTEYAWFVWSNHGPRPGQYFILSDTSLNDRKRKATLR